MASQRRKKVVYLDVCALCRPFDDQSFLRIKIEADAVNLLLSKAREGGYRVMVSSAHHEEIEAISDEVERIELTTLLLTLGEPVKVNTDEARKRAEELAGLGFGVADAAHIAFAEHAGAAFITCDDNLIKKCARHDVKIWCGNPVAFCEKEALR